MHSKWELLKGSPAFVAVTAVCLLMAGIGGYYLLADRPAASIPADSAVSVQTVTPVQQPAQTQEPITPEDISVSLPEPTPEPEPEISASAPVFIPDDKPVIVSAPTVVVSPLEGDVLTAFSVDRLVYNETLEDWRTHDGVDIAAEAGEAVLSASAGTVLSVNDDPLMGTTVTIDHADGYQTTYANLQTEPDVAEGDLVFAGQIIGTVGETAAAEAAQGPHLHFSVSKSGIPVDPNEYLK